MANEFDGNTTELFNFINNDANRWRTVETYYRLAEAEMKNGEYVPEYLECRLLTVCFTGAMAYIRAYCPRSTRVEDMFPFETRRKAAKLLVRNFETEIGAGNSWLG